MKDEESDLILNEDVILLEEKSLVYLMTGYNEKKNLNVKKLLKFFFFFFFWLNNMQNVIEL